MDEQKLRDTITELHTQLEQAQSVDPATRDLIRHLSNDLQAVLRDTSPQRYSGLGKRLTDSIQRLETSHPNLVLTIGRVLDHLAQV